MSEMEEFPPFTKEEAREHVEYLKEAIEAMGESIADGLSEAYERKAHVALGYSSWEAFVETEFKMTRRNAGYILDRVRLALTVTAESQGGNAFPPEALSTRAAQVLKGDPEAPAEIAAAIDAGAQPAAAVKAAVEKRAKPKKQAPVVIPANATVKPDQDVLKRMKEEIVAVNAENHQLKKDLADAEKRVAKLADMVEKVTKERSGMNRPAPVHPLVALSEMKGAALATEFRHKGGMELLRKARGVLDAMAVALGSETAPRAPKAASNGECPHGKTHQQQGAFGVMVVCDQCDARFTTEQWRARQAAMRAAAVQGA